MSSLIEYYQRKIASGEILEDEQQLFVLHKLQSVYEYLMTKKKLLHFLTPTPKGMYLWGSVGIGKTFIIDTFYHFLPIKNKWRIHFLAFMEAVQHELRMLQGQRDPLVIIAKKWCINQVICFDEFAVDNITDALLLGRLLEIFFKHKIFILFTSNVVPDKLYLNGIQRELFLPIIEKIKAKTEVIHLTTTEDYRTHYLGKDYYYWYPLTTVTYQKIEQAFAEFTQNIPVSTLPLQIYNREIKVKKRAGSVIWFEFIAICGVPRCQVDYLAIVKQFDTLLISDLRPIQAREHDLARCFIQLIDVLYEAKTRVVFAAALPIDQIYREGKLSFEFQRTCSRLKQMQFAKWTENTVSP